MRTSVFVALVVVVLPALSSNPNDCVLYSYGRGVGTVPTDCRDKQKDAGLCYPYCRNNFYGVGPVCWEYCPSGFTDVGVTCQKPEAYGRGAGYALWNENECERDNPGTGCEKWGAMWYPKCKSGFHNVACCVCSPDCPSDMTDAGADCTKNTYGRGVGTIPDCKSGEEKDAGLCYNLCKAKYDGAGPVCWEDTCPAGTVGCGFLCLDKSTTCPDEIKQVSTDVLTTAIATAIAVFEGNVTLAAIEAAMGLLGIKADLPDHFCTNW